MNRLHFTYKAIIGAGLLLCLGATFIRFSPSLASKFDQHSIRELEKQLQEIDAALHQLSRYTPRSGVGRIGFRSESFQHPDHSVSLRIDLEQTTPIDLIVLVPTIVRNAETLFRPDGFPSALRILDDHGKVLATRTFAGEHRERIAPLIIPVQAPSVSGITIEATRLGPRAFDGSYIFQLSEIMVFSGTQNVALGKPVIPSSSDTMQIKVWAPDFLTDGSLPYLMNAGRGQPSLAYLSPMYVEEGKSFDLSVDLGQSFPLSEIHLHTTDQSDTIPQSAPIGIGVPRQLRIEGANQADFSDALPLFEGRFDTPHDLSPILMYHLPGTHCRYVRLLPIIPYLYPYKVNDVPRIGFAEIELFSGGRNVALYQPFSTPGEQTDHLRPASALSDGRNIFGQILPLRQWMQELAQRHEMETLHPLITKELRHRYAQQMTLLWGLAMAVALLASGVVITILLERNTRQRAIFRTREQIAADLHDELGANLHAMAVLSDVTRAANIHPEKLDIIMRKLRALTEQTGTAVRHCTNLLEADGLYGNLPNNMMRASKRLMADLDHDLSIEGEEWLNTLSERNQMDIFLFHKECLANILRHSLATQAASTLVANQQTITLTVTDNEQGLGPDAHSDVPTSLARRARLMGAQVSAYGLPEGGCRIILKLKNPSTGRFWSPMRKRKPKIRETP